MPDYSSKLPEGSVLVWLKRYDTGFGTFLSDADLAWFNNGHGVYAFRDVSLQGISKEKHPTTTAYCRCGYGWAEEKRHESQY